MLKRLTGGLTGRTLSGGAWVVASSIASNSIRFISNLVLARLLFPEAFGLMALVSALAYGVSLILDTGGSASIIASQHGDERRFLDTVWTLQIVRGFVVSAILAACAWPVAWYYSQPALLELVLIVSASAALNGFVSTKPTVASRNLDQRRVMTFELASQIVGTVATIVLSLAWKDPNALALGVLIGAASRVVLSDHMIPGVKNRFHWERRYISEIIKFGARILPGSFATFVVVEGVRIVSGSVLDLKTFSLWSMALALVNMFSQVIENVTLRVLFPTYSQLFRQGDQNRLRRAVERARWIQLTSFAVGGVLIVVWGNWFFRVLYDQRYSDGGPLLSVLGLSLIATGIASSYGNLLVAMNRPVQQSIWTVGRAVTVVAAMLVGNRLSGPLGLIVGYVLASWLSYPITALTFSRYQLWLPKQDAAYIIIGIFLAWLWVGAGGWHELMRVLQ